MFSIDSPISVVALTNLLEVAELQDSYKAFASDITSYVAQSEVRFSIKLDHVVLKLFLCAQELV